MNKAWKEGFTILTEMKLGMLRLQKHLNLTDHDIYQDFERLVNAHLQLRIDDNLFD